jgi:hypothetical protein
MTLKPRQSNSEERAYLEGRYEALAWVTTSPAIPRSVIDRIEAEARSLIPRLEELGATFQGPSDA